MPTEYQPPNVLLIAGNDPSGGAGIAADITTCSLNACHPVPVITSLTVQDTQNVYAAEAVSTALLRRQIEVVLDDMKIHAIKLGVLANAEQIALIHELLNQTSIPMVIDPVLVATGGGTLTDNTAEALTSLLPLATVITPNHRECTALSGGQTSIAKQINQLQQAGARNILLTGGDETSNDVRNIWYAKSRELTTYSWPRLSGPCLTGQFHGSGCTLASTLAARLALGETLEQAIPNAQKIVHQMLSTAYRPGQHQAVPNRLNRLKPHSS